MTYLLHIGDPAYSSWSLRGWLLLRAFDLPFETRLWRVGGDEMAAFAEEAAPARLVPALEWTEGDARRLVWDSLAIAETLAERHPDAGHWPAEAADRAAARSLAAEMHSGFAALRAEAPMNVRRRDRPAPVSDAARADLHRLAALWGWARGRGRGGPFLFGARPTAADCFFAPILWRVDAYALPVDPEARAYLDALAALPAMREWAAMAEADPRRMSRYEEV